MDSRWVAGGPEREGQAELTAGQVICNPRSGERIVIRQSGSETAGRLLAFDLFLPPGGHVPAAHVHPIQAERFTVVSGRMRFRIGRRTLIAGAGSTIEVEPGTAHWFGNVGQDAAALRVEVRPALRTEELLERSATLGVAARILSLQIPKVSDLLLLLVDFQRELAVPHLPAGLVRLGLLPLLRLAAYRTGQHR